MVVTAGGKPEVVAPLNAHPAEALSAISALRVGGSRATTAATILAAQSLESAPPGPRAIIVYTQGPDEQAVPADRLSQAVLNSEALVNVIQTGTDSLWPSVVDQAGGVVVTTNAENIVQSFGDLAAALGDQYLVTFEAPGELPAVAQVTFQTGDQEYTTDVNLPDAGPAQAAPTESSEGPPALGAAWLVALLVAGLTLTVLGVLLRRARQLRPADGGEPATEMAKPATDAPPPDKAAAANAPLPQTVAVGNAPLPKQAASSPPPADIAAPNTPPPKEAAVPTASRSRRPWVERPTAAATHLAHAISAGAEILVSCHRGSATGSAHPGLAAGVTARTGRAARPSRQRSSRGPARQPAGALRGRRPQHGSRQRSRYQS